MKRIFMIVGIIDLSILLSSQAYAKIDKKAVVGMWLFEEGAGNTAIDTTGKGNDGTIAGPKKWAQGKFGKGLQFDGSSVWVEVPFNDSLILEEATIVAWGKIKSGKRWQSILMRGQNPRNYLLCTHVDTGQLLVSITKGAKDAWAGPTGKTVVTDDVWHHLACVIGQKAGLAVYVDGKSEGMQAYGKPSLDADPKHIRIGDGSGGGHLVEGILDEVALFNIPLEEAEIKNIMDNGLEFATGMKASVESEDKLAIAWGQIKLSAK